MPSHNQHRHVRQQQLAQIFAREIIRAQQRQHEPKRTMATATEISRASVFEPPDPAPSASARIVCCVASSRDRMPRILSRVHHRDAVAHAQHFRQSPKKSSQSPARAPPDPPSAHESPISSRRPLPASAHPESTPPDRSPAIAPARPSADCPPESAPASSVHRQASLMRKPAKTFAPARVLRPSIDQSSDARPFSKLARLMFAAIGISRITPCRRRSSGT